MNCPTRRVGQERDTANLPSNIVKWATLLFVATIGPSIAAADGAWQLTFDAADIVAPRWSPDGTRIAFVKNHDIWVMPADGGAATQLTHGPAIDGAPDWSPDGIGVAFQSHPGAGSWAIWTVLADGGTPTQISDGWNEFSPAWSPDGSMIAYQVSWGVLTGFDIWSIDLVGGTNHQLTTLQGVDEWSPCWSPDGQQVAFEVHDAGTASIFISDATEGTPEQVTFGSASDGQPAWSPSGSEIAFRSNRSPTSNQDIWVLSLVDQQMHRVTDDDAADAWPTWAPNGTLIAFASSRGGGYDLWVISTEHPVSTEQLSWGKVKGAYR